MKIEKFEAILELEFEVRGAQASVAFSPIGLPDYLHNARVSNLAKAREALSKAIDKLSPAEMMEFGKYRAETR